MPLSVPDEAEQFGKTAAFGARLCFSDEKTGANQETIPSRSGIAERWSIILEYSRSKDGRKPGRRERKNSS
jgi:hypothetical protein